MVPRSRTAAPQRYCSSCCCEMRCGIGPDQSSNCRSSDTKILTSLMTQSPLITHAQTGTKGYAIPPMPKDEEIQDALAQERSRGRKQPIVDAGSRRRRKQLLAALSKALETNDERQFLDAIRQHLGLKDGSPEFLSAWRAWQEHHGRR